MASEHLSDILPEAASKIQEQALLCLKKAEDAFFSYLASENFESVDAHRGWHAWVDTLEEYENIAAKFTVNQWCSEDIAKELGVSKADLLTMSHMEMMGRLMTKRLFNKEEE